MTQQRIKGGFRSILVTELGQEQICGACQQAWPLDGEFFIVTRNSIGYQCKACISERTRQAPPLYQPTRKK
jgi:hypothetical protein